MTSGEVISSFTGKYEFLSNFYPCPIEYKGIVFPTTEHAYQAMKSLDQSEWYRIRNLRTPGKAKREGRKIKMRSDWDLVKDSFMYHICKVKFSIPEMRAKLLATGNAMLIEGNNWGDTYWGVCNGKGQNKLGRTLMRIRTELNGHFDYE